MKKRRLKTLIGVSLLTALTPAAAALAFSLRFPVACTPDKDCFVQSYVDIDPSGGAEDYRCGHLTYDGHKGTDIRVAHRGLLAQDIPILAAADGIVKAVRNHVPDTGSEKEDSEIGCGNAVLIEHEEGWDTLYCHMKQGSVVVTPEQEVKAGYIIGAMGYSGFTAFPHLHLSVRKDGQLVDPFLGENPAQTYQCGGETSPLWDPASWANPADTLRTVRLNSGFLGAVPTADKIEAGAYEQASIDSSSGALTYWVDVMGPLKDDVISLTITGPNGQTLTQKRTAMSKNRARQFLYIGKRRPDGGWPAGTYRAHYQLLRNKEGHEVVIEEHQESLVLTESPPPAANAAESKTDPSETTVPQEKSLEEREENHR